MKDLFTIGELAKLFGMNIRTLRYYNDIGILIPERTDKRTGYRYYSTKQFERLNTIKYLRALNMPLDKIGSFFESKDIETLTTLLMEQQRETREKIQELRRIDDKIGNRLSLLSDSINTVYDQIEEICIEERSVAFLKKDIPVGDDLEYPIRELERMHNLEPLMFLGKVGVSISEENLRHRNFGHFSGIFVFVEEADQFQGDVFRMKKSDYAVIRFSGTHVRAGAYYNKLLEYMEKREYGIGGGSVEVTLIDSGITNDESRFVTEIQIPVIKPV